MELYLPTQIYVPPLATNVSLPIAKETMDTATDWQLEKVHSIKQATIFSPSLGIRVQLGTLVEQLGTDPLPDEGAGFECPRSADWLKTFHFIEV